jgi:DNA-3-methyladenine glycosylase
MAANRDLELAAVPTVAQLRMISSGPGRLSEALRISRERDNAKDFTNPRSDLWFAAAGDGVQNILATPRIGVNKAVHEPLRFVISRNPFVSGPRNY